MRHLITGGSGFLGGSIARRLAARGESVAVLDTADAPGRPPEVAFLAGDVLDRESVARAMRGAEIVHHAAALVPLTKAGRRLREVNGRGSRIVAEEAVRAGARAFVHVSSSAVYGLPARCPVPEDAATCPVESYGASKLEGERQAREVCARAGLPLTILRPRTILGPGRLGIFSILFEWIRDGRRIYVLGDGRQKLQFVHADDLIDGYLLAVSSGRPGVYNVGGEGAVSLRELLGGLIDWAGSRSRVVAVPARPAIAVLRGLDLLGLSPLAPWHYLTAHKDFFVDSAPLRSLGWRPRYSQQEMLRQSYRWFRDEAGQGAGSPHRSRVRQGLLRALMRLS